MDKNTIIGFVLMALVLIGFSWYSRPSEAQLKAQRERDSIAAIQNERPTPDPSRDGGEKAGALLSSDSEALALTGERGEGLDSASILFAASQGTEELITLENDLVKVVINTRGGVIEEAVIKGHLDQQKQPVRLLTKEDAQMILSLATKQENIVTSGLYFQPVTVPEGSPEGSSKGSSLLLRLPVATGSLDIEYTLRPDAYMVDMIVRANGIADLFTPSMKTLAIQWADRARQLEKGFDFEQRYACIRYHEAEGDTDNLSETSDEDEDIEEKLDWIAFKNQFFSAVIISQQEFSNVHLDSKLYKKGQGYLKSYKASMQTAFDPTGQQPTQLQFYLGPNFGLHMGLVLLLLTIIVKALVYPATKKSYLASARMRVLKPKIDQLNAKYPKQEDAMKKQQEMMQLYSQYGVSPMGGCLPMLIQMPIWIALFNFVPNAIELRGQSFLWADDLSAYDDVIRWNKDLWLIGDHLSIFCVLFCVMQVANTWISMKQQQSAAMSPEQEQSMKMMKWMMYLMPLMFFFMFNTYSSGLNYYYFLSGLTSILIMWFLRKTTNDSRLLAELEAYKAKNANNPKKQSGMAARFEALQKQVQEQQRQQQKR